MFVSFPNTLAWERYIDGFQQEQQWIEVMVMRSGLGLMFVNRFLEVLRLFKLHVQAVGNEKDIQLPGDAKRYFCFFLDPGSVTFKKLWEEQKMKNRSIEQTTCGSIAPHMYKRDPILLQA